MRKISGALLTFGFFMSVMTGSLQASLVAPGGSYGGKSYTDLEVEFWQQSLAIPVVNDQHPLINGGPFGSGNVTFLTGVVGAPASLEITISGGRAIFLPVINAEVSVFEPPPFHGDDEAEMRAQANEHIDNTSGLFAEIDGVPVANLGDFRIESPLFQWGPLPADNLFAYFGLDAPAGTTSDAVDAGVYLFLKPLSRGVHTLRFGGTFDEFGASIDTTYVVNVVPEPGSWVLLSAGVAVVWGLRSRHKMTIARLTR